jgi:dTDP-glucose 4,6-dehydratase
MDCKTLISGTAGFIGSNYCRLVCEGKRDFVIFDLISRFDFWDDFKGENKKTTSIKVDVCDRSAVFNLFEHYHFDYVIHFAAETDVDRSYKDPDLFYKTNVIGTQVLLDACLKYGVKRFHQVSTDEVYGDLPLDRPDLFFTEESPLNPSNPYSASKAAADLLVMAYHKSYGLPVTISRSSNNYGPYQFPEKLIPLMIKKALNNEPLPIYGNGLNIRDWIYVEDHCRAIQTILEKGKDGEIYNVGGHNERTNLQIVKAILKVLNKPESLITYVKDRPAHDRRYALNTSKIENELGWKPEQNFEEGLVKTVKWYQEHKEWLDDFKAA